MAVNFEVDFTPLSKLGEIARQAQQRLQIAQLYPGSGGDLSLARLAIDAQRDARDFAFRQQEATRAQGNADRSFNLDERRIDSGDARDTRDFGFRREEAQRAQTNADRAYNFQRMQAEEAARGYELREVDDGAGGKTLVRIHKATGKPEKVDVPGVGTSGNPFATTTGKTDDQQKAALYANRMLNAERILRTIEPSVAADPWERVKGVASDKIGVNMRGPEYQKFENAQRDFINAVLRRESGAVISDSEFDSARKQYFPMVGDDAETVKQKRQSRMEAIRGIGGAAGPGYRPDYVFDAKGEVVNNPSRRQSNPAAPAGVSYDRPEISEAREAIARGAPREKVMQRLKDRGISFSSTDLDL